MPEEKIPYLCDPSINKTCPKSQCYLKGGPCYQTIHKQYAKKDKNEQPICDDWLSGGFIFYDKVPNNFQH